MRWQDVKLQSLYVGKRLCVLQTRDIGNCRMRADVDDDLAAGEPTYAAIIQGHFDGLRPGEAPAAHDQLGAGSLIRVEMQGDLAIDHLLLAQADLGHIGRHRSRDGAELGGVLGEMRDSCAPDLILARHTGDCGAGAADPSALDNRNPPPQAGQMPGKLLAALAAAKDEEVIVVRFRH
jgi:hypothetical protein